MSVGRCGVCGAPTLAGAICNRDWEELEAALGGALEVFPVLESGPTRGPVEEVRGSSVPGLVISVPVMEAKRALASALCGALSASIGFGVRLAVPDAVRLLRAHRGRLRGSWAAPVLLVELGDAVRESWAAAAPPRGRMSVPGRCRECGPSMLHLVGGVLECDRCETRMSICEVRRNTA